MSRKDRSDRAVMRVFKKTHEAIGKLAQKTGMRQIDILDYLVDLAETYDLLSPDWRQKAIGEILEDERREMHEKMNMTLQKEKGKVRLSMKRDMLKEYMKALEPEARKQFIGNMLGDMDNPEWMDSLGDFQVIMLDGRRKLVRVDQEGKPIFPDIRDKSRIVTCRTGYHVKDNFCECRMWRDCSMRVDEYASYKVRIATGKTR